MLNHRLKTRGGKSRILLFNSDLLDTGNIRRIQFINTDGYDAQTQQS